MTFPSSSLLLWLFLSSFFWIGTIGTSSSSPSSSVYLLQSPFSLQGSYDGSTSLSVYYDATQGLSISENDGIYNSAVNSATLNVHNMTYITAYGYGSSVDCDVTTWAGVTALPDVLWTSNSTIIAEQTGKTICYAGSWSFQVELGQTGFIGFCFPDSRKEEGEEGEEAAKERLINLQPIGVVVNPGALIVEATFTQEKPDPIFFLSDAQCY